MKINFYKVLLFVVLGGFAGNVLSAYAFPGQYPFAIGTASYPAATAAQISQEVTALQNTGPTGLTNVTITPGTVATISNPAVFFTAYDPNAYGTGQGGRVLIIGLPLGYQFKGWNTSSPTTFAFIDTSNTPAIGSIIYVSYPYGANPGYFGGKGSGFGTGFINWKELVPSGINPPTTTTTMSTTSTSTTSSSTATTTVIGSSTTTIQPTTTIPVPPPSPYPLNYGLFVGAFIGLLLGVALPEGKGKKK